MKKTLLLLVLLYTANLFSQNVINVEDTGWHLWLDKTAKWKNDSIYLPGEFKLSSLAVNPPTKGWQILSEGKEISLPSTVEQHFWGVQGFRDYKNSYTYEDSDPQVKDGRYLGVSWWSKDVDIPSNFAGKKVILKFRGARLRAEVFVNQKLVGYNIINEVAFDCDISDAIIPGKTNQMAVRITNPGGQMDWYDVHTMQWGNIELHSSHGFGGIDRGVTIEAHDPIYIRDLWVLNHPELNKVTVYSEVVNCLAKKSASAEISYDVFDMDGNVTKIFDEYSFSIPPLDTIIVSHTLEFEDIEAWSMDNPTLYDLRASLHGKQKKTETTDIRTRRFGFRWFAAEGIGEDAMLTYNGERIRLLSSISWGFWGLNGLFPTPDMAKREVVAAKKLGMNCIQFHRNIGKTEVLDLQDELGLYRYMEPGGGRIALGTKYRIEWGSNVPASGPIDTTGTNGEPLTFAEKFMEEKIIRMVRDHRSHPSLLMYCVQNEMVPDLANPRVFYLMKRMRQEDPSRIIALHSGVETGSQVWYQPYDATMYYDHGDGYSGWWDMHTVGGPGVWKDEMYKNKEDFTHRSDNKKEIVTWGEMLGAAVPDNHAKMVEYIKKNGGDSYDLKDHEEILAAYDAFIDKWGFREVYPKTSALFYDIGEKSYDFWGRVVETAKLSDENDFLVMSGWESTSIENHSGLLDNQRNFKASPKLISKRVAPLRPVIKLKSLVIEKGETIETDLFLINETLQEERGSFSLSITSPDGTETKIGDYNIPEFNKDKFVYLLAENVKSAPLNTEGDYVLKLTHSSNSKLSIKEKVLVVNPLPDKGKLPANIGFIGYNPRLVKTLENDYGIKVSPFDAGKNYDLIIASHSFKSANVAKVSNEIEGTDDDFIYQTEIYGAPETMEIVLKDIPKGNVKFTFKFSEVYYQYPQNRVFDVAVNGSLVIDDFDIFATAGKNKSIDKEVDYNHSGGLIKITFPEVKADKAKICGLVVEAEGLTKAINFGGESYTDKNGLVYEEFKLKSLFNDDGKENGLESLFAKVKSGTPLLLLPADEGGVAGYAESLKQSGAVYCTGYVGKARQPWMGSWVFVKENPVFNGLPVDQAMKTYYQVGANDADGLLVDGNNVEVFAGYSRDHDRNIGAASFVAQYGKGKILFQGFYGLTPPAEEGEAGMQQIIAKRLLYNSLVYLK